MDSDQEVILSLENLHCINCVGKVEGLLGKVTGVHKAGVNLTRKQARLDVTSGFDLSSALEELAAAGFPARRLSERQSAQGRQEQKEQRALLLKMGVAGCVAANVMILSVAMYVGQFQGMEESLRRFFEILSFALTTPLVIYCGRHFAEPALRSLRSGHVTIDLPITLGLAATYTLSVVSFLTRGEHQYFDTVSAFLFVLLVGRYLQSVGMSKVRSSLDLLLGLRPQSALRREANGDLKTIPLEELQVGDLVVLDQGDAVPGDGRLTAGRLEVDESAMTGESLPVLKQVGDALLAGSKVFSGQGDLRLEAVGGGTVLSRLGKLIEETQEKRLGEGRMSGRVAGLFSLVIVLMAALVFLWWLPSGLEKATLTAVSVLVITCPCALGLSLPLAFWMAVRSGAERGVLIKDEAALEVTPRLTDLVLDKTGTVSVGQPQLVAEWFAEGQTADSVGPLVELLERQSPHPFARALVARFDGMEPLKMPCCGVKDVPGRGRRMKYKGVEYFLGHHTEQSEGSDIELTAGGVPLAGWRFDDALRPEAAELVRELKRRGLRLHLVSGDRPERTAAVAGQLGIEEFQGGVLPEGKALEVERLQQKGSVVGLLGDGVNDGPALACADVGAAMGHAAAVATASAPVLLLRPGLKPVLAWLNLGRAYRRTVASSLAISLCYNLIAVPVAALGYVSPLLAAIAMPLSSLAVVVNSLRLNGRL